MFSVLGKHSGDKYGDYINWGYQLREEGVRSIENMASCDLTAHFPACTSYHCHVQTLRTSWDEMHLQSTGKLEISLPTGSTSSEFLPYTISKEHNIAVLWSIGWLNSGVKISHFGDENNIFVP